jgi:hypothetical protein
MLFGAQTFPFLTQNGSGDTTEMAILDRNEPKVTNFGLFSKRNMDRVAVVLDSLGVRYFFEEEIGTEAVLREWEAWDEYAAEPGKVYNLWTHYDDYNKIGTAIVDLLPERKFGAS